MLARWTVDLAAAWKGVRGSRWAAISAVAVLALGTGASVTAGAVAYAGLLRPLPFPLAGGLVTLAKVYKPTANETGIRLTEFNQWSGRFGETGLVAGFVEERLVVRNLGTPVEVRGVYVQGPFFEILGVGAAAGRTFADSDSPDAAVLSQRFAVRIAGSAAAALGRTLATATRSLTIVGVMPSSFSVIGDEVDVWTPARGAERLQVMGPDDARNYSVLARVATGRTLGDLRANADTVLKSLVPENQRANWHVVVRPLREALLGDSRPVLIVFMTVSLLVLLIASASVAMLLVNRAISRTREFALRLALGATHGRLLRTLLIEALTLGLAGAVAGWAIAMLATPAMASQAGLGIPRLASTATPATVAVVAMAVALLVVVLCAAAPVVAVRHAGLAASLRAPASTASRTSRRLRGTLVVAQLAMAIVLLTGAALLGRTMAVLSRADLGLGATSRVVTLAVPLGQSGTATDAASRASLVERLLDRVRQIPGVQSAGLGGNLPPTGSRIALTVRMVSDTRDAVKKFDLVSATDGYLESLGAQVVQGRLFERADSAREGPVAVLSEAAVRHLALSGEIIGRDISVRLPSATGQSARPKLIGVIRDVRFAGLETPASGAFYVLWRQIPMVQAFLVLRTTTDPRALVPAVSRAAREIDPSLPWAESRTLDDVVGRVLAPRAARFGLVGVYAGAAILLALVGLTGALVRSVIERQRELAIRAAIGATPARLKRLVLADGLRLAAIGAGLGVAVSALASRAAASLIYGVSPYDPWSYAGAVTFVVTIALVASYWPARRAAAVDPVILLRSE